MRAPTEQQYEQYDALVAAGVGEDVAAYLAGIDECHCVMPEQSCRMCRGAALMANAPADLGRMLEMANSVAVAVVGNWMVVDGLPWNHAVVVDNFEYGVQALVDSGFYRQYDQHIGGRTLNRFVAEPVEGRATGPTFDMDRPGQWQVSPQ